MKPRKKNNFLTFLFSFIPGAAEMYMGYMKNGVSLLAAFFVPLMITGMFYSRDYLGFVSVIVYVFGFFHARNIATAPDEEFEAFEDKYFWEEFTDRRIINIPNKTVKKWSAIILIFLGVSGIWGIISENIMEAFSLLNMSEGFYSMAETIIDTIPSLAFSILVIVAGVMLIRGKKKELVEETIDGTIIDEANKE